MKRSRIIALLVAGIAVGLVATHAKPIGRRLYDAYLARFVYPKTDLAAALRAYRVAHPGAIEKRLVVDKSDSRLSVYANDALLKTYAVLQGRVPEKDKEVEGDLATPEGEFYICRKNPTSAFHKFLLISYPSKEDAERGLRRNLITPGEYRRIIEANENRAAPPQDTRLGSNIGIHGGACWTLGCISLTDEEIDELYGYVDTGTPVVIRK